MALYGFVVLGLPDGMIGTAWPAIRPGFGLPLDGLGLFLLLGTAGTVCSSSASGVVLGRLGLRSTMMLAGLIGTLGALGAVLAPAFWALLAAGAAIGVTGGLLDGSLNIAVALAGRNRLLNALHGFYGVGTTIGPLVVTAAILISSWRPAYGALLVLELGLVGGWWAAGRQRRPPPVPARNDAVEDAVRGPFPSGGTAEPAAPLLNDGERAGAPAEVPGRIGPPGPADVPAPAPSPDGVPADAASPAKVGPGRRLATTVTLGLVVFMVYTGFEVSAGQWGPVSNVARSTWGRQPPVSPRSVFGERSLSSVSPWLRPGARFRSGASSTGAVALRSSGPRWCGGAQRRP